MADGNGGVLAIETSCDESAVAIVSGDGRLLASRTASQIDLHARYGGVVPEVASRNHLLALPALLVAVLHEAGKEPRDFQAYAATSGPGLASSLLVGMAWAKGLALGAGRRFIAVNHIEGHLLSPFVESACDPHVALVVSGGHTLLFDVAGAGAYQLLGRTLDDAAGESFDKVGKLLGLPYPGGAAIEAAAQNGDPCAYRFPRAMLDSGDFSFSFSGLKTAVRYLLEREPLARIEDVCAAFQEAVVDVLVGKALAAAHSRKRKLIAVSGGVSCNGFLRMRMEAAAVKSGIACRFAPAGLCTDNAAMIAWAAHLRSVRGLFDPLSMDIAPNFDASLLCSSA